MREFGKGNPQNKISNLEKIEIIEKEIENLNNKLDSLKRQLYALKGVDHNDSVYFSLTDNKPIETEQKDKPYRKRSFNKDDKDYKDRKKSFNKEEKDYKDRKRSSFNKDRKDNKSFDKTDGKKRFSSQNKGRGKSFPKSNFKNKR